MEMRLFRQKENERSRDKKAGLFQSFTLLLTSVNTYCRKLQVTLTFPRSKKKKKKGQVKHWGSQENDISCTPVRTTITNPNKPTATYNSRRSRAWVQLYNHNHDYHHLFRNSQFMKFINSLKHLFSSYYVLGTMLPVGPTEMNKDLNIKFCFQKQMSCSRT